MIVDQVNLVVVVTVILAENALSLVSGNHVNIARIARPESLAVAGTEILRNAVSLVSENHVKILRAIVQRMKLAADRMRILAKHVLDLVLGRRVARIRTARQGKSVVMVNVLQNVPFVFRTVTAVKARGVVV